MKSKQLYWSPNFTLLYKYYPFRNSWTCAHIYTCIHYDHQTEINDRLKTIYFCWYSQDLIVEELISLLTTIEWAMAELMRRPELMKKAQEEVSRIVGEKAKADVEDLNQMKYLKNVIKETLRFHPPGAFFLPRETSASANVRGCHSSQDKSIGNW